MHTDRVRRDNSSQHTEAHEEGYTVHVQGEDPHTVSPGTPPGHIDQWTETDRICSHDRDEGSHGWGSSEVHQPQGNSPCTISDGSKIKVFPS